MNHTEAAFRENLQKFAAQADASSATLTNLDLDTGYRIVRGEYELADIAYQNLLARLTSKPDRTLPAELKRQMLDFFVETSPDADPPQRVHDQLEILRTMRVK